MTDVALLLAILPVAFAAWVVVRSPTPLRLPLLMFNGFYLLTSVVGAVLISLPGVQSLWALVSPGLNTGWLSPGTSASYWLLVLGPFVLVNLVAGAVYRQRSCATLFLARNLSMRPSVKAVTIVGLAFIAYCLVNLAIHGYLGVSLLNGEAIGGYRENIQLRTEMASTLGELHFGLVYMGIPSVCAIALFRAVETRSSGWWFLFAWLAAALTFLYLATLTKASIIVFLVAMGLAANLGGVIRARGVLIAGLAAVAVLALLESLLEGTGLLDIAAALSNIVFRLSSSIPYYCEIFPSQQPFVGIDFGLLWFGIGPKVAPNLLVFDYMYPGITWVQGAAPAPAHVVAYAEAGVWWSMVTMALMGAMIGVVAKFGRVANSPLSRSLYVGGSVGCYYLSQTGFFGVINHAYGVKWWAVGVAGVFFAERALRWLEVPSADRGALSA